MAFVQFESGNVIETDHPEFFRDGKTISAAKGKAALKAEAVARLRELFPPGSTVPVVLRHVSSSGMTRRISVLATYQDEQRGPGVRDVSHLVARAVGWKLADRNKGGGVVVGGCGMDMGFHLVYTLSAVLYHADGYRCLGEKRCPSNYHTNHRPRVSCPGVERGGDQVRCYRPSSWHGEAIPADWPMRSLHNTNGEPDMSADAFQVPAACLFGPDGEPTREVCPTCKGEGSIPNPDGPERFDLVHQDGYALRHEWV